MTTTRSDRIPLAGILLALALGALLAWPAVARGDSFSSSAAPSQYRGPSSDVPSRGLPLFDAGVPGGGEASRSSEGWARWEFWFEYEKDVLLRDAFANARDGSAVGPGAGAKAARLFDALRPGDLADRVLPALRAALEDPSARVREAAALALGNAGDRASLDALAGALRASPAGERRAAALALGFLRDPGAVPHLRRALDQDPDAGVRALAAMALGLSGERGAAPALRAALARSLEASGRDGREVRVAAVTGLGLLRDREGIPLLQRILLSPETIRDDRLRAHAATALGRAGDPAAAAPLQRALAEDGDLGVRRSAALALGAFRDGSAADLLRRTAEGDGDVLLRGLAAVSYARVAGASAVPALAALTEVREDRSVRGFAAAALGLTACPRDAAPVLRALLDQRSEDSLRGAAAIALGMLGDRESAAALSRLARDGSASPELRGYALLGAAMTGEPQLGPVLRLTLSGRDPAEVVRSAALAAGVRPFQGSPGLLLRRLMETRDPTVRGAALLGLGLAPDRSVVPFLADAAGVRGGADAAGRLAAVTALGQVASGGALPPVARLASGVNWRELTPVLDGATRLF
jgi:HEAT repeat protein